MKNLLNLGVSDPLTLGMTHPVTDRLETLGRARPTTWRSRCLALSAMSVIALASSPLSVAADETKIEPSYSLNIVPDMSESQLAELRDKLDAVSSGQADKSTVTDFMEKNGGRIAVSFNAAGDVTEFITSLEPEDATEIITSVNGLLERCKAEQVGEVHVMRAQIPSGPANVRCVEGPEVQPVAGREIEEAEAEIGILMASDEFETRAKMAKARGTMAGALIRKKKREFPDPTPQEVYDNCVRDIDYLNRFYPYEKQTYDAEQAARTCAKYKPQ